jgi:glycosyltransferase involved in cell wall biosynthesis
MQGKPGLRVLMFSPQLRPVIGGAERQAEKQAQALAAAGCKVTILTPRIDKDSPDLEYVNGVTIKRVKLFDLSAILPVRGIAIINIPVILWQVARLTKKQLKENDVLHCHIASLHTAGASIGGRLARVPVICKAAMANHRSDFDEIEKTASFTGPFISWLLRKYIGTWVATTVAVKEALIRGGVVQEHIVHIPNGVVVSHADSKKSQHAKRFLYVGRLSTNIERDVPTVLKAFNRLSQELDDIELALVGGGDLLQDTQAEAAKLPANNRIHIPGFDKSEKWFAWADCFVLPSRREGLSNALLEAMAAGLSCIANDIPPNREVLNNGEAGILVPVGDLDSTYNAMKRMAAESGFAQEYAQRATDRVKEVYSIGSVAAKYLCLYHELINK